MGLLRSLLLIFIMTFGQTAWAQTEVAIQVNKSDTGQRVVFLGMTDDFALFSNEIGEVKIRFNPNYIVTNYEELKTRLGDEISNLVVFENEISFRLKNRAYQVKKYSSMEVFAIDIIFPENVSLIAEEESNIEEQFDLTSGAFEINGQGIETSISYTTERIVAAAALRQNNKVWLFFQGMPSDFKPLNNFQNDLIADAKFYQVEGGRGVAVGLTLTQAASNLHLNLKREQNIWYLRFDEQPARFSEIRVLSKPTAAPAPRVEISLPQNALKPLEFKDPDSGLVYQVLMIRDDSFANSQTYNFVDFRVLESFQGTIIQQISDSIVLRPVKQQVIIQNPSRLNISNKRLQREQRYEDAKESFKLEEFVPDYKSILSLRFYRVTDGSFVDSLRMLRSAINRARTPEDRVKMMANLAMFYTANGLYYESLGTITAIKRASPTFYNTYNVRTLEGANYFMIKDYKTAFESFTAIKVADVPTTLRREVRFWQLVTAFVSLQKDPDLRTEDITKPFFEDNNFLKEYTVESRQNLALAIAVTKIEGGDFEGSLRLLKYINKFSTKTKKLENLYNLYNGQYYLKREEYENANKYFDLCLADESDLYTKARCSYYKAVADFANMQITKKEYTNKLNFITYIWHGDDFEKELLIELGDLYESQGDYHNSFRVMDKAVSYFTTDPRIISIKEKASRLFADYFLDGIDKKASSFEALTIFYDFQKYLPIGEQGDDVVLRFTEHLIALDLLDRAAAILNHQVNHRLRGYKREEAINRLAFVHNANRQSFYAVEVLRNGEPWYKLPEYIGMPRKYLLAESYYLNHQDDDALLLLQEDYSLRSDQIKSDIYWRQQNWRQFLNYAEPRIYDLRKTSDMVDGDDSLRVLRLGIAYLLNGDYHLLVALNKDFAARLDPQSVEFKTFNTIFDSWQSTLQNDVAPQELIDRINTLTQDLAKANR